ncbi:MAG: hypothetical protein ACYDEK_10600, partial [Vulcanimicrobiaceae bacterium]
REIEDELGGYPEKKKDYPQRALEALHVAIDDYRRKVASGAIPDYAAMPAPRSVAPATQALTPPAPARDAKIVIQLH